MVQIWYEVNNDVKWIMVNVGPPRSRYQDRTDVQEIYGRKMSEKDKGEGAGVGRESACPPQWGSDSCDGRAGRKQMYKNVPNDFVCFMDTALEI